MDKARVSSEAEGGSGIPEMRERLQDYVKLQTGYRVVIVAKEHLTFMEGLQREPSAACAPALPEHMLAPGSCIPLALASVAAAEGLWARYQEDLASPASQRPGRARAYRDVAADAGVRLSPALDTAELRAGSWLLHMENGGRPHCVGLRVHSADRCAVRWSGRQTTLTAFRLQGLMRSAIDKKTFVLFEIHAGAAPAPAVKTYMLPLLDLMAGAARR